MSGMENDAGFEYEGKLGGTLYSDGNGYFYRVKEKRATRWRLTCHNSKCKGSGILVNPSENERRIVHKDVHKCGANKSLIEVLDLRRKLLKRCREEDMAYSRVFNEETTKSNVKAEVAAQLNFSKMESAMSKTRKRDGYPVVPQSIEHFLDLIEENSQRFNRIGHETFLSGVVGEEDDVAIIFVNKQLQTMLAESDELHLDGTFKCVPKKPKFQQLFTVMAMHRQVAFPVVFCLMTRKSRELYEKIFNHLKEKLGNLAPARILSDFESGLKYSVAAVFPTSKHVGCWFHFSQCIYRKVQKIGLATLFRLNTIINKVVQMVIALALLPYQKIEEGLETIETFFSEQELEIHSSDKENVISLFRYVRNYWIGRVGSKSFSVFEQKNRTNNCQENFHGRLNKLIGGSAHPNIWNLLGCLVKISTQSYTDSLRLERDGMLRRNRKTKWLLQDKVIKSAQVKLTSDPPQITIHQFLLSVSHRFTVNSSPVNTSDYEDDDLVPLEQEDEAPLERNVPDDEEDQNAEDENEMELNEELTKQKEELRKINISADDTVAENEFMSCLTCCINQRSYSLEPCGQFALCGGCCILLIETETDVPKLVSCPVCRVKISGFRRTYY